jgi:hypothetical protein
MGATTRLATFVTGLFLLSCVVILGPIVGFIPMAVLAPKITTHERRNKPVTNVANRVVAPILKLNFD